MPTMKKRRVEREVASPAEESDAHSSGSESTGAENPSNENEDSNTATSTPKTFKDLGIIDSLVEACETLGYKAPTPIVRLPIFTNIFDSIRGLQ